MISKRNPLMNVHNVLSNWITLIYKQQSDMDVVLYHRVYKYIYDINRSQV